MDSQYKVRRIGAALEIVQPIKGTRRDQHHCFEISVAGPIIGSKNRLLAAIDHTEKAEWKAYGINLGNDGNRG